MINMLTNVTSENICVFMAKNIIIYDITIFEVLPSNNEKRNVTQLYRHSL